MAPDKPDQPLSPEDARTMIGSGEAEVIDIREDEEAFAEGHLVGAAHVPGGDPDSLPDDLSEEKTLVVVCETGERSAEVAEQLRERREGVTSIEGGMKSWVSEGLPVQPDARTEFQGPKLKTPGT
jgi:rhodanese-related sulfurtransferase